MISQLSDGSAEKEKGKGERVRGGLRFAILASPIISKAVAAANRSFIY